MPSTASGITYPASTAHTRIWEHLQTLAESVDTAYTKPSIGKAFATGNLAGVATTETIALTVSSMVFKAGWAYRAYIRAGVFGTAGAQVHFRLRKTNTSGTDWGEYGRVTIDGASTGGTNMVNGSLILLRSAGTDLTTDVVLTVSAATGSNTVWASATSPRYLIIEPIGKAADYSGLGVDVT